jgi:hypothetical protein
MTCSQFVVAKHPSSRSRCNHPLDDPQTTEAVRATIHEVAQEDRLSTWRRTPVVWIIGQRLGVPKLLQKRFELNTTTVDITDQMPGRRRNWLCGSWLTHRCIVAWIARSASWILAMMSQLVGRSSGKPLPQGAFGES